MCGFRSVLGPTLCPAHRNAAAHHRPANVWDYKDTYEIYLTLIKTLLGASILCAHSSINPSEFRKSFEGGNGIPILQVKKLEKGFSGLPG